MEILKDEKKSFYTKIDENYKEMSKYQLKEIISTFCYVIPSYINNPKIYNIALKEIVENIDNYLDSNQEMEIE